MNKNCTFTGIVFRCTGSRYEVYVETLSRRISCMAKGKLRLDEKTSTNPIAIGDKVELEQVDENAGLIHRIYPRKNVMVRRSTNLSRETHVLAANLDCAYLVVTLVQPVCRREFIDRFLVSCEAYNVPVKIVVNKIDLYDEDTRLQMEQFASIYNHAGYEIIFTSAAKCIGIDILREDIKGKLSLFSGSSGVGKSSVISAIDDSLGVRTGELSAYHQKGKHTTTFYEVFEPSSGGYIIDTPGIKSFGLVDIKKEELYHFFPELFRHAARCKYNPCSHTNETTCAVRLAVEAGDISPERYESYLKMLEEEGGKYR